MLKKVDIDDINLDKGYFHFTNKNNLERIAKNNLLPKLGKNSHMIEVSEKIFFSIGASNILKTHDVWLKWLMNRMYGSFSLAKKYDDYEYNSRLNAWINEFLSKEYKNDEIKKDKLFTKYYYEMLDNVYLILNLTDGYDYDSNDYDEVKLRLNKEPDSIESLFMKEMYGEYSNISSNGMDSWNMHTIRNRYVKAKDVQIITFEGKEFTVIEMLKLIYDKYKNVDYDLLDDFMVWLKAKET